MRVTMGLLTFFVAGMFVLQPAGIVQAEDIGITLDDLEDGDAFAVGSPSGIPVDAEGKPLLPEYSSFAGGHEEQGSAEILTFPSLASNCKIPKKDFEQPAGLPDAPRIVTIFDVYQDPPVSTGPEALLDGDNDIVEPNPDGYNWGAGCKGRVRFVALSKAELLELVESLKTEIGQSETDDAVPNGGQTGNSQTGGQNTGQTFPGDPTGSIHQQVGATTEEEPPNGNSGSTGSQTATTTASGSGGSVSSSSAIGQITQGQGETTGEGQQNESSGSTESQETQTGSPTFIELDPCPKISDEVLANPSVKPDSPLGSSTNQQAPVGQANSDPIPVVWLNNLPTLEPQFFVNDQGTFDLYIKNDGIKEEPASQGNANRRGKCFPKGTPATPMKVKIEVNSTQSRFLLGIPEQHTLTLAPQESHKFRGWLMPYLHEIKLYEQDILFGAKIKITVWPVDEPNTILYKESFNVYLFLDAADSNHADGIVTMARTLGDGPGHVIRSRPFMKKVHSAAAVRFTFEPTDPNREFSVSTKNSLPQFLFDPLNRGERKTLMDVMTIRTKAKNEFVGSLTIQGTAEPKNKIFFNFEWFDDVLDLINRVAQKDKYAQDNPPDWHVHPALVPTRERSKFDTQGDRKQLGKDVKKQMEKLWGSELMHGLQWVSSEHPNNTVTIRWVAKKNFNAYFAMGATPAGTENFDVITQLLKDQEKYSWAELSYRLSEVLNTNFRDNVNLSPDGMLEWHWGVGKSKVAFERDEIINMFAKTAVHEIGHSMSLDHPAQAHGTVEKNEFQKLTLHNTTYRSDKFQLAFHNQVTPLLPFYTGILSPEKVGQQKIQESLVALRSVGTENYYCDNKKQPTCEQKNFGVRVYQCSLPSDPKDPTPTEATLACVSSSNKDQTFILQFKHHLGGTTVDPVEVIVNTPGNPAAGTVETIQDGSSRSFIKFIGTEASPDARAIIDLEGYTEAQISSDIMYGGWHDFEGKLKFRSGLSLEPMKMALALNYTEEDVEKIVKLYKAKIAAYKSWGKHGFK